MRLKKFVAISMICTFSLMGLVLILGLLVPESVLRKIANNNSSAADSTNQVELLTGQNAQNAENPSQNSTSNSSNTQTNQTSSSSTSNSSNTTANSNTSQPDTTPSSPSATAPVVTISASPTTISSGSSSLVGWSINNSATQPVTCTASGAWSGSKSTSGSQSVSPTSTSTYTISCSNAAGTSSKSVTVTVNAVAGCGSGGSCSLSDVSSHNTQSNCWLIVAYTASGGNGTGKVYKISSSFFGGTGSHSSLPGAPSLSASSWCGKNISSTFNSKHSGGSRSDGSHNAIWWLTNNGNSLIGNWTGN